MKAHLLREISAVLGELDLGIPEARFRSAPKRALNTALRQIGAPGVQSMEEPAELRRALARLKAEV